MNADGSVDDYDPFSAEVLDDPFGAYARLRARCPVHRFDGHEPPFLTVSRYDDVMEVLRHPEVWSNRYGVSPQFQRGVGLNTDPPHHTAFRLAVLKAFTPKRVAAMQPAIEQLTDDLLDAMVDGGDGGDLHDQLAAPLPVIVIARMLGIPESDHAAFKDLSDRLQSEGMNSPAHDRGAFMALLGQLDAYWEEQLAPRREALAAHPGSGPEVLGTVVPDDLLSALLVVRVDDRPLSELEVTNTLMNLFLGGNETTTSLLTNLVWRLLQDRSRWEAVRADRSLVDVAIEESLRFDAPALGLFRTSLCPAELDGVAVPAKTKVMVAYGAANHDPERFADPDAFRLDRPRDELRRHVAFGHGNHACPGAPLSRLEARVVLPRLLDRFPQLRLDGPAERTPTFNFWGRQTLPVAWG